MRRKKESIIVAEIHRERVVTDTERVGSERKRRKRERERERERERQTDRERG